ncbi:MAG: DUF3991 and toprim domain-containing protein [Christensenellales bacterium]|jgi:5S rRNA maturation endonuclease (ribonuclease M5)
MAKSMQQSYVTREQIEKAKQMDLLSYLKINEPDELVRINPNTYSTRTHDSLKISNGKWCWWSRGIGGRSALDYLIKVRGMEFVEAAQHLCGCAGYTPSPPVYTAKPPPKLPFMLPKPYINNDRVLRYLTGRGIDSEILEYCVQTGRLYEDERHNCVFVGFDDSGKARYAMLRSSSPTSMYLREVDCSDKRYAFALPFRHDANTVYLFESAIDLLSFATMQKDAWRRLNYLSLSGVYQPRQTLSETPLPAALAQYLHDYPHVRRVILCLDNDEAGKLAAKTICALLPERYAAELSLPDKGKDYNRQLQIEKGISSAIRMRGEPER